MSLLTLSKLGTGRADNQRAPWLHQDKCWHHQCTFMLGNGRNSPQFYLLWGAIHLKWQQGWAWAFLRRISWMDVVAKMVASLVRRLLQDDQGSFQGAGHGKGLVRLVMEKGVMMLFWWQISHTLCLLWRSYMLSSKRLVYWFLFVRFIALFYERKYCIILIRN